jgi:HlyD family secretion protein
LEIKYMKRIWIVLIGVVVIAAGGAYYFFAQRAQAQNVGQLAGITQEVAVSRGSLSESVGATGTLRAGQSAVVNWETSGKVSVVNVSMGDAVKEGDVLAELDKNSLPEGNIVAESDLVAAERELEDLKESNAAAAAAYQALVDATEAHETAVNQRIYLENGRASEETIAGAEASYILAQDEVDKLQSKYDAVKDRDQSDPARANALSALANAKKTRDKALVNLNWLKADVSEEEFADKDAAVMVAEAALEDAQREYDRLKDGPDPDDIKAAEAKIESIQATIDQYRIEAPFDAKVTDIEIEQGDLVSQGSYAFRLDDLSRLYVDIQVSEVDINNVAVGQACLVTFDAIEDKEYHGEVTEVSQVGVASSGVVYFDVTVQVTDADELVKAGMTAIVDITIQSSENALLVPTRAITSIADKKFVTMLIDGQPQQVEVTVGMTSGSFTEITGGDLNEGDSIQVTAASAASADDGQDSEETLRFGGGLMGRDGSAPAGEGSFGGGMP